MKSTTGNPDWVLGKVVDHDVTFNHDTRQYEVWGAKDPCCDALYQLAEADPPLVVLKYDGAITVTDAGRARDAELRPAREEARRRQQQRVADAQAARVAALEPHRGTIETLAEQGRTDTYIGDHLGIRPYLIGEARRAWGKETTRRRGPYRDDRVDPDLIAQVAADQAPYRDLTLPERAELLRAWTADGGGVKAFADRYGVNGIHMRELREAANALTAQVLAA